LAIEDLRRGLHESLDRRLAPLSRALLRLGITPNHVTVCGTAIALGAPVLLIAGRPLAAGIVWLVGSSFDLLDGALARSQGRATRSGALLDSTLDRIAEGALFAAIAYDFAAAGRPAAAGLTVLALLGALLISYIRARIEGLGGRCVVGLVTRAERVVLLAVGLCFGVMLPVVYLLVLLSAISAAQRLRHGLRELAQ